MSPRFHCRIISFKKNVKQLLNYFVDVDGLFIFAKWWKFITKRNSITSLIFILKFQIF